MHCGSGQSFKGYLVVTSYHRGAGTGGGGGHHADTLGWLGVVRGLVSGLQKAGQYNTWRDKTPLHCIYSVNPNPYKSQAINMCLYAFLIFTSATATKVLNISNSFYLHALNQLI